MTDAAATDRHRALARVMRIGEFRREWINHPLVRLRTHVPQAHGERRYLIERYPGRDLTASAVDAESSLSPLQLEFFDAPILVKTSEYDVADQVESARVFARR